MTTYRNLDAAASSPELSAILEAGIGVTAQGWERFFKKIDASVFSGGGDLSRALGSIGRFLTEVVPEPLIDTAAYGLAEYLKRSPRFSAGWRIGLASLAQAAPDIMQNMKRDGVFTKEAFIEELELQGRVRVNDAENALRDETGWLDPKTGVIHRSTVVSPPKDLSDQKLFDLLKHWQPSIADGSVVLSPASFPELKIGQEINRKGESVAVALDLGTMGLEDQRKLALFWRILELRLRDGLDRPRQPHALKAALGELSNCPGALKALTKLEVSDDHIAAATGSLRWLESFEDEGGVTVLGPTDLDTLNQQREHLKVIDDARDLFAPFEVILRSEAKAKLSGPHKAALWLRDAIDDGSTAADRAGMQRKLRNTADGLLNCLTNPWFLGLMTLLAVTIVLVLPVLGLTILVLCLGMAGVSGAVALWGLWLGSYTIFNGGLIGVVVARLLVRGTDYVVNILRGIKDFFDPTDGTGLIGGSIKNIGDFFRAEPKTLEEKIRTEEEKRLAKEKAAPLLFMFLTIVIVSCVVGAAGNVWILFGQNPVVGVLYLAAGWLTIGAGESMVRGYRALTTGDNFRLLGVDFKARALKGAILAFTIGAVVLFTLGTVIGTVSTTTRYFAGDAAVDKSLVLMRESSEKAVIETAKANEIPLNEIEKAEYQYRDNLLEVCHEYQAKVAQQENAQDARPGSTCRLKEFRNAFPCDCSAEVPAKVLAKHPELLKKPIKTVGNN